MVVARRIASPLMVLLGFALVAWGMYSTWITLSARSANWPLVIAGAVIAGAGLLIQVAPLSRRLIGAAMGVAGIAAFVLGYPLYGLTGVTASWLWIPAIALVAAGVLIARGRSWWTLLAVIGLACIYIGIGLFIAVGPVGWWPLSAALPESVLRLLALTLNALWPIQVAVMAGLVGLTAIAGAAIDPGRGGRKANAAPDGTMYG